MTLVIGFGSGGQDLNSQAVMHLTSLMDDATSERWIRRLEFPGTVEWQHLDVARSRAPQTHRFQTTPRSPRPWVQTLQEFSMSTRITVPRAASYAVLALAPAFLLAACRPHAHSPPSQTGSHTTSPTDP